MNARLAAWRFIASALFDAGANRRAELERQLRSSELSWRHVVSLAGAHFVTPSLWLGLVAARLDGALPADARRYLQALYEMNRRRNAELLVQIDEAIDALSASGIAPLLLKGAAYLKLGVYADVGARVLSDIDMLVPLDGADAARRALEAIGYVSVSDDARPAHHHLAPLLRPGSVGQIELHVAPVSPSVQQALTAAEAWQYRVAEESGRFSVLSPLHTLLHRVIHDQIVDRYDSQRQLPLRSLLDLVTLDAHYGPTVDWAALRDRASRAGYGPHFRRYLYAASRVAGLKLRLDVDFGVREAAHLGLCKSVVRWDFARGVFATLDDLSAFCIRKKFGEPQTFASMSAHRIRTVAEALRRRWGASDGAGRSQRPSLT